MELKTPLYEDLGAGIPRGSNLFNIGKLNFDDATTLTISSGAITIAQSIHYVDTEGGAASDDLDTINGGSEGDILYLRAADPSRTVVIKHSTGNIVTPDGNDYSLDSTDKVVALLFDGTNWHLVGAASSAPAVHGNEAHSPDFLAVDGSNTMQGDFSSDLSLRYRQIQGFLLNTLGEDERRLILPGLQNALAFCTLKGGSATFSVPPADGTAARLFNGKSDYVYWSNPSGTITVEVVFPSTIYWGQVAFVHFQNYGWRATAFTVEYYNPATASWVQIDSVTNWGSVVWAKFYNPSSDGASKLKFSFTAFSSDVFGISQIGIVAFNSYPSEYSLKKDGDDMYGDIDMHGNGINNLNCINLSGGNLGVGTTSPGYALDVSGDIHCTGKLTSDGGNDPPYVLYDYETRTSIIARVKKEVLPDKLNGAVLFFNGDRGQLELFLPSKGEFRSLDGKILGKVESITETFETEERYYFDEDTGEIKSYKVKKPTRKHRLKPDHELNPLTGKIKRKIKKRKKDPKTGEEIEEVIGEEEVPVEEAIELIEVKETGTQAKGTKSQA